MRRAVVSLALGALAPLVLGCETQGPMPVLSGISPETAYTDREVRLILRGDGLVPSYELDTLSGQRRAHALGFSGRVGLSGPSVALTNINWRSPGELSASVPAGLPPGAHQIEVTDPRGRTTILSPGFVALGPDAEAPTVRFDAPPPESLIGPGVAIEGWLLAEDRTPGSLTSVEWEARLGAMRFAGGSCPVEPASTRADCPFKLTVPDHATAGGTLELVGVALDGASRPNRSEIRAVFRLLPRPTATTMVPSHGGSAGGTDIVIRGSGFVPGTQVMVGNRPLVPNGGILVDERTISGRVPAHAPGPAMVVVRTPIGETPLPSFFTYILAPLIEAIAPEVGDSDGGTAVRVRGRGFTPTTRIYFGATLTGAGALQNATFVDGSELRGTAPPGRGAASVWAVDPELGWTRLVDGFSWMDTP